MPGFSASHSAWFTVEGLVVKAINRAFQSSTAERFHDDHHISVQTRTPKQAREQALDRLIFDFSNSSQFLI
jgi:hypothetical protein